MSSQQPYVTIRSRRPDDGSGSGAGEIQARSATHDISRASFHLSNLSQFASRLENSATRAFPNRGRTSQRYQKVQALLLHWGSDDLFVLPELEDLEKCLREEFSFGTDIFAIPSENSHLELMLKVGQLIKEHESHDTLFLIYYGGHARIDDSRQSTWCATRDPDSSWLQWSAIQTLVERSKSDVLILLDCCAGAASATFPTGDSITETISASSWDAIAPDPGRYSFTNALIEVLQEWRLRNFSAAMLHAEVLARLKHPRPIHINGKLFEARSTPVHFMMTANHKAPSIELSRIVPADQLPPSPQEELDMEVGVGRAPAAVAADGTSNVPIASEPNEDTPHVMISLALEDNQSLDIHAWEQWLSAFPAMAKYVKVQGVFKSHSTLLLVSMPVMIWDLLPEDHATSFVAFIRSNNLAVQKRQAPPPTVSMPVRQHQPETSNPDTASFVTGTTFAGTEQVGVIGRFDSSVNHQSYGGDVRGRDVYQPRPATTAGQPPSPVGSSPASSSSRPMRPVNSTISLTSLQRLPTSSSWGSDPMASRQTILNQHQVQRRTVLGDNVPEPKRFSAHIERRLEEYYQQDPLPNDAQRAFFASNLGIELLHLDVWFHHRRERDMFASRFAAMKPSDLVHDGGDSPRMILPADLDQLLRISMPEQILFFDLRTQSEFQRSHVHNAINLRAPESFMKTASLDMISRAFTDDQSRRTFSSWEKARCLVFYARGLDLPWECPSAEILSDRLRACGWHGRCFILKGHYREFSGSYDRYIVGTNMTTDAKGWVVNQVNSPPAHTDSVEGQELYAAWLSHVETEDRARPVAVSTARTAERVKTMALYEQDLEQEFRARNPDLYRRTLELLPHAESTSPVSSFNKAPMVEPLERGLAKMRDAQAQAQSPPIYDPEYSKAASRGDFDKQYRDRDVSDEYVEISKADETEARDSRSGSRSPGDSGGPTEDTMRRGRGGSLFKVFRRS